MLSVGRAPGGRRQRETIAPLSGLVLALGVLGPGIAGFITGLSPIITTERRVRSSLIVLVGLFATSTWVHVIRLVKGAIAHGPWLTPGTDSSRRHALLLSVIIWILVRFTPLIRQQQHLAALRWLAPLRGHNHTDFSGSSCRATVRERPPQGSTGLQNMLHNNAKIWTTS